MNGQMEKPMGWYKFLVYAGAFLAAGRHILGALIILYEAVSAYLEYSRSMGYFGAHAEVPVWVWIIFLILIAYQLVRAGIWILIREKLWKFDTGGIKLYLGMHLAIFGIDAALGFICMFMILVSGSVLGDFAGAYIGGLTTFIIIGIGIPAVYHLVMYFVNKFYFEYRMEYFAYGGNPESVNVILKNMPRDYQAYPQQSYPQTPYQNPSYSQQSCQNQPYQQPQNQQQFYQPQPSYPSGNQMQHGVLAGLSGTYAGAEIPLNDGEVVTFGRAENNHLIFTDEKRISRNHCSIRWDARNQRYLLQDYSSSGTYLNGSQESLPKNTELVIPCGSQIALGNQNNVFLLR